MSMTETTEFRLNSRRLWAAAAGLGLLGVGSLAAALQAEGSQLLLWTGGLVVFGAGATVWAALARPVVLRIGPDGLQLVARHGAPVAWGGIAEIRHAPAGVAGFGGDALGVHVHPGAEPALRWPMAALGRLERRHASIPGIIIPLAGIDAPAAEILAAIERFHPVIRRSGEV